MGNASEWEILSTTPIIKYYEGVYNSGFIVLHPFYRPIYSRHYDYFGHLRETTQWQPITWAEIMKIAEIDTFGNLAKAIMYSPEFDKNYKGLTDDDYHRLHFRTKNFKPPYCGEDELPNDLVTKFLLLLLEKGYGQVEIKDWLGKPKLLELTNEKIMDAINSFGKSNLFCITTLDGQYCLKEPYNDSLFALLLVNGNIQQTVEELKFEGFYPDATTTISWY